jgi:D-amino-acid dehydrogenase
MLPGMMPVVRASKRSRVFYNTGHGHLGWTLAGITARMTINLLAQQNYLPTRPRPQWHRGEL